MTRWSGLALVAAAGGLALVAVFDHDFVVNLAPSGDAALAGVRADRSAAAPAEAANHVALEYARAWQERRCETVLQMTLWMRERMERARVTGEDLEGAEGALCERAQAFSIEGNQFCTEGIEDQYVFASGAEFELVSVDAGRSDLERPVRERGWVRVTYASPSRAPRDESGRPIRSLVAGVNVSADGYVLKAGILGTVDVMEGSISLGWPRGLEERVGGAGKVSALR